MQAQKKHRKPMLQKLQFEIHLADHCNLNCQMCDHFSPIAEEHYLDIKDYEKQLKRLSELFHNDAEFIRLIGGEPLLHPNIIPFFSMTRSYFPSTSIELYTNGLLLPKQSELFWETCRENNIVLAITKYPVNFDYDHLQTMVENYGLSYFYVSQEPVKTSWHFPIDIQGSQNEALSFKLCKMAGKCIFLKDGILYPCTVPGNIVHFNRFFQTDVELSKEDGINIFEAQSAEEILEFLCSPIPFCKYCDAKNRKGGIEWKQTKKDISEWT